MLGHKILPVQKKSQFHMEGYCVWGGSMSRTSDGRCHLLFSCWPEREGFEAWVLSSQIGYAVADDPLGPYEFQGLALAGRGGDY